MADNIEKVEKPTKLRDGVDPPSRSQPTKSKLPTHQVEATACVDEKNVDLLVDEKISVEDKNAPTIEHHRQLIVEYASQPRSCVELMAAIYRKDRYNFRERVLNPLLKAGLIKRTIPDKPNSCRQQYVATGKPRSRPIEPQAHPSPEDS